MKKFIKFTVVLTMIAAMCLSFCACGSTDLEKNIWENATYTENTELGNGAKTVMLEVKAEDKSVTFTINTDKEKLGEALV